MRGSPPKRHDFPPVDDALPRGRRRARRETSPVDIIDWDATLTAGEAAVALGTGALAIFTYVLARRTGKAVATGDTSIAIAKASLDVARQALAAGDRPWVIATPVPPAPPFLADVHVADYDLGGLGFVLADGSWQFRCRLWNIGRGPAIVRDVGLELEGFGNGWLTQFRGHDIPIPPGQVADERLRLRLVDFEPQQSERRGALYIYFRDSSGQEHMTRSAIRLIDTDVKCEDFVLSDQSDGEGRQQRTHAKFISPDAA